MWLIYFTRTGIVLAPDYQRHWTSAEEAQNWAEAQGYDLNEIRICPVIYPD